MKQGYENEIKQKVRYQILRNKNEINRNTYQEGNVNIRMGFFGLGHNYDE